MRFLGPGRPDGTAAGEVGVQVDGAEEAGVVGDPGEDAVVVRVLHNLFLETDEGFGALAVQEGHVDVEEAHEAVGHVFGSGGLAEACPAHSSGYAHGLEVGS